VPRRKKKKARAHAWQKINELKGMQLVKGGRTVREEVDRTIIRQQAERVPREGESVKYEQKRGGENVNHLGGNPERSLGLKKKIYHLA